MKLATIRTLDGGTRAVRVEDDLLVDLGADDLGVLLADPAWAERAAAATGPVAEVGSAAFAPVVPRPGKIVCVGLNYRTHILEMGRDLPAHPTLFSKYADTLVGAADGIVKPPETDALDWECELAVVIGAPVRRARGADAERAIAGFAVLNDVTCRDWQFRTREWLQGKNWEATTPLGPYLVTPDELPGGVRPALEISTKVDGETVQEDSTADLLFDPVALVEYVSTMGTLRPGDVIATGTPGGVGHARRPPRYLEVGQHLTTEVSGLGRCENPVVAGPGA
ncbi:fumarylacetoacetate hydrolase family protein [Geodermatophilus sp. YIM 151500]|uniref:fumarylacetoacetate hydrolase family protein n=1 Tax=Geodermatophilus sp. YIM 151500 TaxID=2984531 RepID=UPI0021E39358|nr:fumarylacetoacetate hydrolase family protein [Geodermatophilus sp. YIM 151500]MCV2489325.1 fumarylacetoacetate hydrolase family protein [Geodermatophilus sp. YIM 151500]